MTLTAEQIILANRRKIGDAPPAPVEPAAKAGDIPSTVQERRAATEKEKAPAAMLNRAYAIVEVKDFKTAAGGKRSFRGTISTIGTDRAGDIIEPRGMRATLPVPCLWMHDAGSPIGWVRSVRTSDAAITADFEVATVAEEGELKARLDLAWQSITTGLCRGLSVGFRVSPGGAEPIAGGGGMRFKSWELLEVSIVTLPCNADCSITEIRSIDQEMRRTAAAPARATPKPASEMTPAEAADYLRKSSKPATMAMVMAAADGMMRAVREALAVRDKTIGELAARVAELEAMPQIKYDGPYRTGASYSKGTFVTSGGQVWHANRETAARPGDGGPDWTLAVRKGQDR